MRKEPRSLEGGLIVCQAEGGGGENFSALFDHRHSVRSFKSQVCFMSDTCNLPVALAIVQIGRLGLF